MTTSTPATFDILPKYWRKTTEENWFDKDEGFSIDKTELWRNGDRICGKRSLYLNQILLQENEIVYYIDRAYPDLKKVRLFYEGKPNEFFHLDWETGKVFYNLELQTHRFPIRGYGHRALTLQAWILAEGLACARALCPEYAADESAFGREIHFTAGKDPLGEKALLAGLAAAAEYRIDVCRYGNEKKGRQTFSFMGLPAQIYLTIAVWSYNAANATVEFLVRAPLEYHAAIAAWRLAVSPPPALPKTKKQG